MDLNLTDFILLKNPTVRSVVLGCTLITLTSSVVGCFTFLRKRALLGDAVAHSVLPGVCMAFILSGTKNPLIILLGAFITGWISIIAVDAITHKTKIKADAATGLVLSVFFGAGIWLLTSIQHMGNADQTGLDSFIFGKAASMVQEDVLVLGLTSVLVLTLIILLFKEFSLLCFDKNYAIVLGLPVKQLEFILTSITVLSVIVGIQAVGVVLMAAMLITPAAAARFWSDNILKMVLAASLFGAVSGIAGTFISYVAPAMPTGPWIVVVISSIAILSFLFAPSKGLLNKYHNSRTNKTKIMDENILKVLFQLGENDTLFHAVRSKNDISIKRNFNEKELSSGLHRLLNEGFVNKTQGGWKLTEKGKLYGAKVTRLHRLWEMYLTEYLHLAADHVHDNAENIEHYITPEIERILDEQLKYPKRDPHNRMIPGNTSDV